MNSALARTKSNGQGLAKYDPVKGIKQIALAEAAEKHYASAKDATKLQQAIRAKLDAQADFVLWWDSREKNKAGRHKELISDQKSILKDKDLAQHLGTTILRIHRWRQKLNDPTRFEETFQKACLRYVKGLEFEPIDPQLKASESNEWYTPAKYLEAARTVLGGIDLDPASSAVANREVQATEFLSSKQDGLSREWKGRVWLNPPYGGLSGPFAARLIEQFTAGHTTAAVLLVNSNSTDAAWFQPLWDYLLCFTNHRINFVSPGGSQSGSTHGSVFVYLGKERDRFIEQFSPFGVVVERVYS